MPMQNMHELMRMSLGTEVLYSFIIIACSLMIYFSTKELYELSSDKGIKYFRQAFLFFALAYFFRSFIKAIIVFFDIRKVFDFCPKLLLVGLGQITLFIFMYFSAMAIFYFLYSVRYNQWEKGPKKIFLFHIIALLIAFVSVYFKENIVYILLNLLLFGFVVFIFMVSYSDSKKKSKKHSLYMIYFLLLLFWVFNILDILIPSIFGPVQLVIYIISSGIFLAMLYKVIKKTGGT